MPTTKMAKTKTSVSPTAPVPPLRIKEMRSLRVGDIFPHPNNPRFHPEQQYQAVSAIVQKLGIADILLAYESPRYGKLTLIDGHLRRVLDGKQEWPVAVLDFTDEEADLFLLLHDETTSMAEDNTPNLQRALAGIRADDEHLDNLLKKMRERSDMEDPGGILQEEPEASLDDFDAEVEFSRCPTCGQIMTEGDKRGKRQTNKAATGRAAGRH